jgi:hypothetical protein
MHQLRYDGGLKLIAMLAYMLFDGCVSTYNQGSRLIFFRDCNVSKFGEIQDYLKPFINNRKQDENTCEQCSEEGVRASLHCTGGGLTSSEQKLTNLLFDYRAQARKKADDRIRLAQ